MSKASILENIRRNKPEINQSTQGNAQQAITGKQLEQEELVQLFKQALKQVGAEVVDEKDFHKQTEVMDFSTPEAKSMYSADCPLDKLYELETILLQGQIGVAENGAIWMEENNLSNRLLPFVTQQLIIKLDKKQIVNNMHEAYSKIQIERTGFGVFISGPSKTADIEQSLVYGAHGAKSLTVVIC